MFSKSIIASVLALSATTFASPIARRTSYTPVSFNNYGGYGSMSHFDDFYGSDNFSGFHNKITLTQEKEVVCHSQSVEIIQQQLAVLREYAKKIVTEQICEVEVQTVVYTQFVSGFHDFSNDLSRTTGRYVGYDHEIASHISSIHDGSGELVHNNLGFHGSDVGSHHVSPSGNNWDNNSSPQSVGSAKSLAQEAGGISGLA